MVTPEVIRHGLVGDPRVRREGWRSRALVSARPAGQNHEPQGYTLPEVRMPLLFVMLLATLAAFPTAALAQKYTGPEGRLRIALAQQRSGVCSVARTQSWTHHGE